MYNWEISLCELGYGLEVVVAGIAVKRLGQTIVTGDWFESIEIAKMLILFGVGLPRSQCLGKRGEPGTKEAGHLKVAPAGIIALCIGKVGSDALVWEWIASLGVALGASVAKADVEEGGSLLTFVHHACLACTTRLNDGGAAKVRLGFVCIEFVIDSVEVRDKGEEAIGCVTTVGSIKPVFKMNVGTDHLWISGALDMRLCEVNDDHGKGLVGAIESGESRGEVVVDSGKLVNDGGNIVEYVFELWYDCAKPRLVFDEAFGH